jgi:signal peptidase I
MARRMLLTLGACAALLFTLRGARRRLQAVEVAGESMLPALRPGEFLLVRRGLPAAPEGYIAYLHASDGRPLLKRIVGLPGESLRVGSHVEVNGRTLTEEYAAGASAPADYRGVNRLGSNEYFVLGDNRAASTDSRHFGPVPAPSIEGVTWLRYWPVSRFAVLRPVPRRFAARSDAPEEKASTGPPAPVLLRDGDRFGTTS